MSVLTTNRGTEVVAYDSATGKKRGSVNSANTNRVVYDGVNYGKYASFQEALFKFESVIDPPGDTESPDGTRVLLGSVDVINDSEGSQWALDAEGFVLRNGQNFNAGTATQLLYLNHVLYRLSSTTGHWYSWGNGWTDEGVDDPEGFTESTQWFRVPDDGTTITDNLGQVWSLNGNALWMNSADFHGGFGNMILYDALNNIVYHRSPTTGIWYNWNYATEFFDPNGTDDPETGPPPDPEPTSDFVTTGSIAQGSNILTVSDPDKFSQTEITAGRCYAIVEITEAMVRGTKGVGGNWPSNSFATEAALRANTTLPIPWFSWALDTKKVWVHTATSTWVRFGTWQGASTYYADEGVPRSLVARVVSKIGNELTLDGVAPFGSTLLHNGVAQVAVTNATVYVDQAPFIVYHLNQLTAGQTLNLNTLYGVADGLNIPIGGVVYMRDKTAANGSLTLRGNSKTACRIFVPRGCNGQLEAMNCYEPTFRDFTFESNWGDNYYIFNVLGSTGVYARNFGVNDGSWPQGARFPYGINLEDCYGTAHAGTIQDVHTIDTSQRGQGCSSCLRTPAGVSPPSGGPYTTPGVRLIRPKHTQNEPLREYVQWHLQIESSPNSIMSDPELISFAALAGIELHLTHNCHIYRPKSTNGFISLNVATGNPIVGEEPAHPELGGGELRYTDGCWTPLEGYPRIADINSGGMIYIHTNSIGNSPENIGAQVIGVKMVVEGYQNNRYEQPIGVYIANVARNCIVRRCTYNGKDFVDSPLNRTNGAQGVFCFSPGGRLGNNTVTGTSRADPNNESTWNIVGYGTQSMPVVNEGGNVAQKVIFGNFPG